MVVVEVAVLEAVLVAVIEVAIDHLMVVLGHTTVIMDITTCMVHQL